jgi:diguanylate cyclase (GGDEF)-like protein
VDNRSIEPHDLRRQLARLKEEAKRNEETWRRAQQREMALLEAESLADLLERLVVGLRVGNALQAVTLRLVDPDHEVRRLLEAETAKAGIPPGVTFIAAPDPPLVRLAAALRPWLGPYNETEHGALFEGFSGVRSVALVPLLRQRLPIGSLNLGSAEPSRFTPHHASDFLHHLGVIAAFCLENAINRGRLVRSGFTDVLTGWHNRRYLHVRLEEELARSRRNKTPLACLMIDVDHFKAVNDRHGHLVGDEVLRNVARRIHAEVRSSDVSARYGGEEFVLLLPDTTRTAGYRLAERVRRSVCAEPFDLGLAEPLTVTVSIGVAEYLPRSGADGDAEAAGRALLAQADAALYEAKAGGRNAVAEVARL